MTPLSDEVMLAEAEDISAPERVTPVVDQEEDVPLHSESGPSRSRSEDLSQLESLKDKMNWKRLNVGSTTLYSCIGIMTGCILLSLCHPDNTFIETAFDAFKMIAVSVLGYIFGSNAKE